MKTAKKIERDRYRSVEHTKKNGPKKHKKAHVKAFARYSFALPLSLRGEHKNLTLTQNQGRKSKKEESTK
jgi:hypothetical protein